MKETNNIGNTVKVYTTIPEICRIDAYALSPTGVNLHLSHECESQNILDDLIASKFLDFHEVPRVELK